MKCIFYSLLLVVFFSCNSDQETLSAADSSDFKEGSSSGNRADLNTSCCFQSEKDFTPFFPDTCGKFTLQPLPSVALKCVTDTLTHSSARYGYANAEGHLITVTLADYCTSPQMLQTDYSLQFERCKNAGSKSEFNEFDVPDSHHGFTHFDDVTRTATLVIVVDKRFIVEIDDQVCANTKSVLTIYEKLPLASLAAYGK